MPELKHRNRTLLWTILGVLGMLAIILILGTIDDPHGDPILDTPGAAFVQTIATAGLVVSVVLPLLRRTQKDAAETKEHVANDHKNPDGTPVILRDDIDGIHALVTDISGEIRGVRRDIGRLATADQQTHEDVSQLRRDFSEHVKWSQKQADKLTDLEDTIPKPSKE